MSKNNNQNRAVQPGQKSDEYKVIERYEQIPTMVDDEEETTNTKGDS